MKKELVNQLQKAHKEVEAVNREAELESTISHLRAELREKKGIIEKFQSSRGGQIELARSITESVKALVPIDPILYVPKNPTQSEVSLVMNLSDLHVGELIRPAETGGFGAFNYSIAQKRMRVHEENVLNWTEVNRRGYNIPDLTIFGIGDYISGDIHQELLVTNEFPITGQVARAADLISNHIRNLAPYFRSVTFHGIGADNHGRLQKKPQAKQKAANNMSFVVHALVEAQLRNVPNFQMITYEDMMPLIEIANHRFIVTHGDTVKTVQGLPWYGLERWLAKEALRRMKIGGFDYANVGHYHTPLYLPKLLMNGSLSGTTEYDHSAGRFGSPSQITYLVHRKHGVFNFTAWKFEVEKEETK